MSKAAVVVVTTQHQWLFGSDCFHESGEVLVHAASRNIFEFVPETTRIRKLTVTWAKASHGCITLMLEGAHGETGAVLGHIDIRRGGVAQRKLEVPRIRCLRAFAHLRSVPCVIHIVPTADSAITGLTATIKTEEAPLAAVMELLPEIPYHHQRQRYSF